MPEFSWNNAPRYGTCLTCGTSSSDGGFIDTFVEVEVKNDMGEIKGVVDAIFCSSCIVQAARLAGSATRQEVEELVYQIVEKDEQIEKLKDEVSAERARFDVFVNATGDELRAFLENKNADSKPSRTR